MFQGDMYFSLRTLSARKDGGSILRRAIGSCGVAGGHQRMAGGRVDLSSMEPSRSEAVQARVLVNLFAALGASTANPVALLAAPAQPVRQEDSRGEEKEASTPSTGPGGTEAAP